MKTKNKTFSVYLREVKARDPEHGGNALFDPVANKVDSVHYIRHPRGQRLHRRVRLATSFRAPQEKQRVHRGVVTLSQQVLFVILYCVLLENHNIAPAALVEEHKLMAEKQSPLCVLSVAASFDLSGRVSRFHEDDEPIVLSRRTP